MLKLIREGKIDTAGILEFLDYAIQFSDLCKIYTIHGVTR